MDYKEKFKKMLDEIGTQPMKAIKAHCFQCAGYNYRIARECDNHDCAFYVLKENRKKKGDQQEE